MDDLLPRPMFRACIVTTAPTGESLGLFTEVLDGICSTPGDY